MSHEQAYKLSANNKRRAERHCNWPKSPKRLRQHQKKTADLTKKVRQPISMKTTRTKSVPPARSWWCCAHKRLQGFASHLSLLGL